MENQIPKTKEECFDMLDKMLSEEDKQKMIKDDTLDYHFTLGLWIRNNWIYPLGENKIKSFMNNFKDKENDGFNPFFYHPDEVSYIIIKKYIEHLRNNQKLSHDLG